MIRLSIVVLSWNTREMTFALLESLQREGLVPGAIGAAEQSDDRACGEADGATPPGVTADCEVWLVDNGSEDGTGDAARSAFPWCQVIALPGNLGFAAGNNAALRRARGRFVLLLNSDVRPGRAAVLRCLDYLEANPRVGAVGVQLLHPDGRLQNSIHNEPRLLTELVPRSLLEWLLPARFPSKRRRIDGPREVEAVLGAFLCVRREAIQRVGLLPEEYFFFLEETDWCRAMRRAGFSVVHLPDVRLIHASGASSKKKVPGRTRIEYHRSLYRYFRRHHGVVALGLVVMIRLLKGVVAFGARCPAALFSARGRERWRDRASVLAWHLRGCPENEGLVTSEYLEYVRRRTA